MKDETKSDPRIGVFICDCGSNIAGYLKMQELVDYAKTLPNVAFVQENLYTCSEGGINEIKEAIPRENLNRVVVASCTPRTHEPLFQSACEEAGLNPYLFEMANIRDQCSWVHMKESERGTARAQKQISMAVAKAARLRPLSRIQLSLFHRAVVIGGGVSGMSAAMALGNMGYEVDLVEKQDRPGGLLNDLNLILPTHEPPSNLVSELVGRLESNPKVTVHTNAEVKAVEGYVGNFSVTVGENDAETKVDAGIIIVAIGARVLKPEGLLGYNGADVINHLELEAMLRQGRPDAKHVVMIQCVGSRCEERTYCSRICCMTAVKNAILLKEKDPATQVTILYRDMQMYGVENEDMFRKSKEMGVRYVTYDPARPPTVESGLGESLSPPHGQGCQTSCGPGGVVYTSDCTAGCRRHIHHVESAPEPKRLFPGRSRQAQTIGFCHGRDLLVRERSLSVDNSRGCGPRLGGRVQGRRGALEGRAVHQWYCGGHKP